MKTNPVRLSIRTAMIAALFCSIWATRPVFAQEKSRDEMNRKVVVKIFSDENGEETVIDTVMVFPEGAVNDSINKEVQKVIEMGRGGKRSCMRMKESPGEYSYNFNHPCMPDCPMDLKDLEELEIEGDFPFNGMEGFGREEMAPGQEFRMMRPGGSGQSLNDLLGDIPMDRVKSYSIKDTRNGKRIVIDLEDAPMFERQNQVIVIRDPGKMKRHRNNQERQIKVYVNTDDAAGTDEKSVPPPPPPPPKIK